MTFFVASATVSESKCFIKLLSSVLLFAVGILSELAPVSSIVNKFRLALFNGKKRNSARGCMLSNDRFFAAILSFGNFRVFIFLYS